jgi:hypothetical protein
MQGTDLPQAGAARRRPAQAGAMLTCVMLTCVMLTCVMLTGTVIDAHQTGTYVEIDMVSTASDLVGYWRFGN